MPEEPRFLASLDLVALPTAVSVARMFISETLNRWRVFFIEDDVVAVGVELVTSAVEATKPDVNTSWNDLTEINPIRLRLLGYRRHIVFEVTDQHYQPLGPRGGRNKPGGSGLHVVDAVTNRWGSFLGPCGRVTWAELAVYERTKAGLPKRKSVALLGQDDDSRLPPARHDPEFLHRVIDGLKNL
ncbi:ATP-binding protein [Kibdelosporangium lantanae]|uniref:ATP-binding protein n=1 Tax=Kibdelosporangium lantanae TaxID=1497396 RepID=A0ABW3M704_9PSEU